MTFLPLDLILDIVKKHAQDPTRRLAQHLLAFEVTSLVHGHDTALKTAADHRGMRGLPFAPTDTTEHDTAGSKDLHVSTTTIDGELARSLVHGQRISKILLLVGLAKSGSAALREIERGAAYYGTLDSTDEASPGGIQFRKIQDPSALGEEFITRGNLLLLRVGKWRGKVFKVVDDTH